MTDKEFERVFKKTIKPLIKEIPSSQMYMVYPILYDALLKERLIERIENKSAVNKDNVSAEACFKNLPWKQEKCSKIESK